MPLHLAASIPLYLALLVAIPALHPRHGPPPILIRHDRADSLYLALGARYAGPVAHVEERAEGTLVAPRWVLTAAHVIESSGPFDAPWVVVGGERYPVDKIVLHPDWEGGFDDLTRAHDLALLKLDRAVIEVRPAPLYRWSDEHGRVATLLGRGRTGDGATGQRGPKGTVLRGATNRVEGATESLLMFVFDAPGDDDATELEGAAAAGDSGGPAFLERDGVAYLAGVGSFGTGREGFSAYGTLDGYVRVSSFVDWIERTIAADPPSTEEWSEPRRHGAWPATAAGRLAAAFFAAYERGSEDALVAFFQSAGEDAEAARRRAELVEGAVREPLGSLEVYGWADAGEAHIRVLVHSASAQTWRSLGFTAEAGAPAERPTLGRFYMKWESAPKAEVWP